jgi:hypothetical protein
MEKNFLYLTVVDEESLLQLQGAFVGYRIIIKPQQGQQVFTLQPCLLVQSSPHF